MNRNISGVWIGASVVALSLLAVVALPALLPTALLIPLAAGIGIVAVVLMITTPARLAGNQAGAWRTARELALFLAPVMLLMVVFPLAVRRIPTEIDGTSLVTLLLASSVTVPWLSQAAGLPLYRAIGHLLPLTDVGQRGDIETALISAWPRMLLRTLPLVLIFAVPLQLALGWSPAAFGVYLALALLHLVFAQSLILTNVTQRRGLWAVSWAAYAATLFIVPTWWFLPPVLGTVVQLIALRGSIRAAIGNGAVTPEPVALRVIYADVAKGFLLGSVLWADKLLLFAVTQANFAVDVVYIALLPVVVGYNYYFVSLAPAFDSRVQRVRDSLENGSFASLRTANRGLIAGTVGGLVRTAAIAALAGVAVALVLQIARPQSQDLTTVVVIASWLFMIATLLAYKLDYAGWPRISMALGAGHLVTAVLVFVGLPVLQAYAVLVLAELLLVAGAAVAARRLLSSPSYALFWRHATAW